MPLYSTEYGKKFSAEPENKENINNWPDEVVLFVADESKPLFVKQIKKHHDKRKLSPVLVETSAGSHLYKGGLESEGAIAKSEEFAIELGSSFVEVWDSNDDMHLLSIEDSKKVRLSIGSKYRTHYTEQKNAINEIKKAKTKEDVESIFNQYVSL